ERAGLSAVGRREIGVVVRMRMIDGAEVEAAAVDFVHHRQMLARLHQEGRARVARKGNRILGVLEILNIGYRADFLDGVVSAAAVADGFSTDDEAAALEGELTFGLRDDLVEIGFADDDGFHQGLQRASVFSCANNLSARWRKTYPLGRAATTASSLPSALHSRTGGVGLPMARPRCRK